MACRWSGIERTREGWRMKADSPLNRRIAARRHAAVAGPRADIEDIRAQLVTRSDTLGSMSRAR
jgi:secreted PhoX family phosphatase